MSTRNHVARNVRQRKLNTKQGLRIIREHEVQDVVDDGERHTPQVETGVEKGEEGVCIQIFRLPASPEH